MVESFAESLDQEEVVKSARHLRQRAKACKHVGGATFEGSLKRILKDLDAVEELFVAIFLEGTAAKIDFL